MLNPILAMLDFILALYGWVVFAYVILQLLLYFKVVNELDPTVIRIHNFLSQLTEPVLKKIRMYVKPYNGFDFSAVILLLAIKFLQYCLVYYFI